MAILNSFACLVLTEAVTSVNNNIELLMHFILNSVDNENLRRNIFLLFQGDTCVQIWFYLNQNK